MKQQLIIFDNHKIPRALRGKRMIVDSNKRSSEGDKNQFRSGWEFASSGKISMTGRQVIYIKGYNKTLYLHSNEYSLKEISRADRAVNKS